MNLGAIAAYLPAALRPKPANEAGACPHAEGPARHQEPAGHCAPAMGEDQLHLSMDALIERGRGSGGGLSSFDYKTWKQMELALEMQKANLTRGELKEIAAKMKEVFGESIQEQLNAEMAERMGSQMDQDQLVLSPQLQAQRAGQAA